MDILKLNKYFLFLIFLLLLSCNDKAKKIEETNLCNQDSIIHYRHNELSILFIGNINKLDNKKIELLHIRNNKIISRLSHSELKDDEIDFTILPELHTNDSLKIVLKNDKSIFLHNFKNGPDYGGQKFLGCFFQTYMLDGKEKGLIDRYKIIVYIE